MLRGILRFALVLLCFGGPRALEAAAPSRPLLDSAHLEQQLSARIDRVEEFRALRVFCQELRIRCWLFGGTAASYGHYVKWDLQREAGDTSLRREFFDYDFTKIYRSTQDADIVIDADEGRAVALENKLRAAFPHLQGEKSAWEVRLLGEARGDKEALLANPDFLNQHTDSNSTGLIELTEPPKGESAVRDLRDWNPTPGERPQFFKDLREGKLHFYFSKLHETTSRFRKGLNPPIIAAVRYLTKAFQFDLEILPEDAERIRRILREFNPERDLKEAYAASWLRKNAAKMFQSAASVEKAIAAADSLGARETLAAYQSTSNGRKTIHWQFAEPLKSGPVGTGTQETASEIFKRKGWVRPNGDLIVSHATAGFATYESLTRSPRGESNALVFQGDFGKGFYTAVGDVGAQDGAPYSIRYLLNPAARAGTDFTVHDNYLLIQNNAAIRVIPNSMTLSPMEYFRALLRREIPKEELGPLDQMGRRIANAAAHLNPAEKEALLNMVREAERKNLPSAARAKVAYLAFPFSTEEPDAIRWFIEDVGKYRYTARLTDLLQHPHWRRVEVGRKVAEKLFETKNWDYLARVLTHPPLNQDPERGAWLKRLLVADRKTVIQLLSGATFASLPEASEVFDVLMKDESGGKHQLREFFTKSDVLQARADADELYLRLSRGLDASDSISYFVKRYGANDPRIARLITEVIQNAKPGTSGFHVLAEDLADHERLVDWIEALAQRQPPDDNGSWLRWYLEKLPTRVDGDPRLAEVLKRVRRIRDPYGATTPEHFSAIASYLARPGWARSVAGRELVEYFKTAPGLGKDALNRALESALVTPEWKAPLPPQPLHRMPGGTGTDPACITQAVGRLL